jgi:hypothetical protein
LEVALRIPPRTPAGIRPLSEVRGMVVHAAAPT